MKRRLLKLSIVFLAGIAILVVGAGIYMQQPKFGALPKGEYLEKMKKSPNYVDGQFVNLTPTPQFREGITTFSATFSFLFKEKIRPAPVQPVPTVKTNLLELDKQKDIVIWLGHSSYYMQIGGKSLLVDPVLSESAAPLAFLNRAFAGANPYNLEDIPEIDYLLITHDHWDHLDYPTVTALKEKTKNVFCPLGVAGYLEQWGFAREIIYEGDWFDMFEPEQNFSVTILPARHFSGRTLERNKTLWAGYAIITPGRKIFISGDGGYSEHFKQIGDSFNGFDLAILENGQYDERWPYVHMTPEQAAQAAEDLQAKTVLPAHAGKFSIANHPWDEPFERIAKACQGKPFKLLTPMIGQPVELGNEQQSFSHWWEDIK